MNEIILKFSEQDRQVIDQTVQDFLYKNQQQVGRESKAFYSVIKDDLAPKFSKKHSQNSYRKRLHYYQAFALYTFYDNIFDHLEPLAKAVGFQLVRQIGPKL